MTRTLHSQLSMWLLTGLLLAGGAGRAYAQQPTAPPSPAPPTAEKAQEKAADVPPMFQLSIPVPRTQVFFTSPGIGQLPPASPPMPMPVCAIRVIPLDPDIDPGIRSQATPSPSGAQTSYTMRAMSGTCVANNAPALPAGQAVLTYPLNLSK